MAQVPAPFGWCPGLLGLLAHLAPEGLSIAFKCPGQVPFPSPPPPAPPPLDLAFGSSVSLPLSRSPPTCSPPCPGPPSPTLASMCTGPTAVFLAATLSGGSVASPSFHHNPGPGVELGSPGWHCLTLEGVEEMSTQVFAPCAPSSTRTGMPSSWIGGQKPGRRRMPSAQS